MVLFEDVGGERFMLSSASMEDPVGRGVDVNSCHRVFIKPSEGV